MCGSNFLSEQIIVEVKEHKSEILYKKTNFCYRKPQSYDKIKEYEG